MKKHFFIVTSILMIILVLFELANVPEAAVKTVEAVGEMQEMMNETMKSIMEAAEKDDPELPEEEYEPLDFSSFTSIITPQYVMRTMYISGILALIFCLHIIEIAMNGYALRRRVRIAVYSVITMLLGVSIFVSLIALVNLIVVLVLKRKDEEDFPVKPAPVVPLEEPDHSKKAVIRGVLTILAYFICHAGINIAVKAFAPDIFESNWYQYFSTGLEIALFFLLIYMHRAELKAGLNAIKENKAGYKRTIVRRTLIGFLCVAVFNIIRILFTGNTFSNNQGTLNSMPLLETAVLAVIWAPIVEELVFRNAIRSFLKNKIAFIIIAATIFGTLHAISEEGILNIFPLS
jgi:membrane protease YdiL (CAAX protease family)/Sec-independent protein translocase protein TatA